MAERRMFAKTIIDSDAFLDMPLSAQALYFHLAMRADDDGFVNNPRKIQRYVGGSEDDCRILIAKRFILAFETGVIVIKHWRIHNYLRKDRYTETLYKDEKDTLVIDERGAYTEKTRVGIPNDNQRLPQDRLGKDSIGKVNNILSEKTEKPNGKTIKEIVDYLNEKTNKNYRSDTESTIRHINARLRKGYTFDDFKAVIDKKTAEWKDTDMDKYLRPETLFGSKFEGYLNEKTKKDTKREGSFDAKEFYEAALRKTYGGE